MPFLIPLLAGLTTESAIGWTLFGLGAGGIALHTITTNSERMAKASKDFTQNSLIPAAIIGGAIYYFVNKAKK